jgi:hypothetical protein
MTSNLYSASLGTRLTETLAYLATGSTVIDEFYPEGLRGSANAYAVLEPESNTRAVPIARRASGQNG